jgi:uncharacterized membrane protein
MRSETRQPDRRNRERSARLAVAGVGLLAAAFAGGTLLVPVLERGQSSAGPVLRLIYGRLCHQIPERSLSVAGRPQAVCARCAGLYLGGTAGVLAAAVFVAGTARRLRPRWLVVACVPTGVDALAAWTGLPALDNVPRLLLAGPAGLVAGLFLGLAVADLFSIEGGPRIAGLTPERLEEVDG